jgi:polyprenyl-phospho-N-acetylgalactosaminyl synthase
MESSKIFIVVPVFNEATVIEQTLRDLSTLPYNIIIVDDGSNDDIKNIARNYPVIFISHPVNLGQGAALQTGMELAKKMDAEIVVHFDADGQHAAADINKLIEPIINDECDIVFGSRFLNNQSSQNIPFVRKIVLQIARYVNWLYTGILLSDAHNGLRALNKKAINDIVISENKMAHASEILYLTKKNNLRYKEVPVTITYTSYSQKKGQGILNSINILIHLIFKKIDS